MSLTPTTLVIAGKFLTLDEGNQTMRTLVGFGAGASHVTTRVQAWMDGQLVAEAETQAESGKKPGAAVTLGAGAVAGTAATAAVVAAGTTGVTELMLTSVEADAKRTAREIADRIIRAYRERGWVATVMRASAIFLVMSLALATRGAMAEEQQVAALVVEPDAVAVATQAGEFLREQDRFAFTAVTAYEVVQEDGARLEFGGTRRYLVRRPDRVRVESRARSGEHG